MINLGISFALFIGLCGASGSFDESLVLKFPDQGHLYAVFNFSIISTETKGFDGTGNHYELFPRNIGDIIKKYNVAEFHLSMSQGLWKYDTWGYPYFSAPPGSQLWVWLDQDTQSIDAAWQGFTNALSGLLCASLNFLGKTETVEPNLSFPPEGVVSALRPGLLRYAVLPRETLCTENLTPWLKMLPCGPHSGISSLLSSSTLHHSQYLSLGLDFKRLCTGVNCSTPSMHLHQSVSAVFDVHNSVKEGSDISVENVLSKKIKGACPVAHNSTIELLVPQNVDLYPAPIYERGGWATYDLVKQTSLRDIVVRLKKISDIGKDTSPMLVTHCHLSGIGEQDGGVKCQLNNAVGKNTTVVVMQTFPWFLQVYFHTFAIYDHKGETVPYNNMTFHPAKIRQSVHFIEYTVVVPPFSTVIISVEFTRGFLTWTEHPPDASHGFYVGSTVVTIKESDFNVYKFHRIYSEAMLVVIPVPDFSMPYNVICLACTVVAIAFGSLHNLTSRVYKKLDPDDTSQGIVHRVLHWSKQLYRKMKGDAGSEGRKKHVDQSQDETE